MCTTNLLGGKGRPARKADNLTAICVPTVWKMWGTSTSDNPMGLHGLLLGEIYLFIVFTWALKVCATPLQPFTTISGSLERARENENF
jgi:hypothetical protein